MVFASPVFLFVFFPVVLLIYRLIPAKVRPYWLLLSSLFFYFWGEPVYVLLMIAAIVITWGTALGISVLKERKKEKAALAVLTCGIMLILSALIYFKYTFSKSDFRAVKVKECVAVPKSTKLLQFTLDDGTGTDRTILSGIHAFYEPEELVGKTCIAITNLPPRKMMGIESCGMLLSAIHEEEGEEKLNLLMVDPHIPAGAKLY